jgi:hypothetical protein
MQRGMTLTHVFVEYIPNHLEDGTIYVSISFATAAHKCCCGCGNPVITPISPTDWEVSYNGETISLSPSIGNWSFDCKAHYWIRANRVEWAPQWSQREIEAGRRHDLLVKRHHYNRDQAGIGQARGANESAASRPAKSLWQRFKAWL